MLLFLISFAGVRNLGITKFEAKIGQENEVSICMFKKLHFKEVRVVTAHLLPREREQCLARDWD